MLVEAGSAQPLANTTIAVKTVTGPIFTEVTQTFAGWGSASAALPGPKQLTQTTRMTHGGVDIVEVGAQSTSGGTVDWLTRELTVAFADQVAHGVPVLPENHELISRFETDLDSDTVWTDDTVRSSVYLC